MLANLDLDHVVIAVADLEEGARDLETRHGLASIEGGRHPGWGTANRIPPLAWLGPHQLPIAIHPGIPALTSVVLDGAIGQIVLDSRSVL